MQQQVLEAEKSRDVVRSVESSEAEKAYLRLRETFAEPPPKPNYKFNQNEKLAIFQDLRDRIASGEDAGSVAAACVVMMEEHMEDKLEVAKSPTKKGPVFRRVT